MDTAFRNVMQLHSAASSHFPNRQAKDTGTRSVAIRLSRCISRYRATLRDSWKMLKAIAFSVFAPSVPVQPETVGLWPEEQLSQAGSVGAEQQRTSVLSWRELLRLM